MFLYIFQEMGELNLGLASKFAPFFFARFWGIRDGPEARDAILVKKGAKFGIGLNLDGF